jgi:aminomethyltransferase
MLKRTPLYKSHETLGGRMVEFGGWGMPVQYSGILDEHHTVRNGAGVFDISHMGRFLIIGPDALNFLQYTTTCNVASMEVGFSSYALLCHSNGGIVDDIFIYRLPNAYLLVVNASNRQKDSDFLLYHANNFNVKVVDYSELWAMLAVQGPSAEAILVASGQVETDLATLPFHSVERCRLFGVDESLISRTGYTGEDGFELFFDARKAAKVWDALLNLESEAGTIKPCGLGARDSLRFEPCLPLYGHEISDETTPYEARLGWVVSLDKGDFVGRDALLYIKQEGTLRQLVGFEMVGRGVARAGYAIHSLMGERIGSVTSGMPSPTLGKPLGMAYVPIELSDKGSEFDVMIRGKPVRARVIKMPFYKPRYKK